MQTLTLRTFQPADAPALRAVFHASVHQLASRDYSAEQCRAWAPEHYDAAAWAARFAGLTTWIAEISGRVAGFASLRDDGYVDLFFVAPDFAGQGVGRDLMHVVLERGSKLAVDQLWADVSETARPFFIRHGFVPQARQAVKRLGVQLHNYRMTRRFT
ncbi:GNAT family N-acetyltransferase [Chitinolyticbacter meiyuanensis]|uniref:GNAT family N-acetyltransferase n=1 Tax=Chitinolyticbacter meiyuanensis TaxID=682798 RepID=UPI0011E5B1AE|nr:GNAT family N-acetyltransferase [Chitinolyticbacter meiyuanensis]